MLTDGVQVSVPANSTLNAFLGRPVEFIGVPEIMRLLTVADQAGLTQQLLINVGGQQQSPISAGTTVNVAEGLGQGPRDDEDTVAPQVPISAGSRLQLNFTNTTAAAITARYRAMIAP